MPSIVERFMLGWHPQKGAGYRVKLVNSLQLSPPSLMKVRSMPMTTDQSQRESNQSELRA
ncbi:MAG: hypothetical protein LZF86_80062 [Nitrospira sp.]|nr:MAG: hypothetical protein LZF86_80062 [Nitrospira sp.]